MDSWITDLVPSDCDPRLIWYTPSLGFEDKIERRSGILLDGAWSPLFLREQDGPFTIPLAVILQQPRICVVDRQITQSLSDWLPFLEAAASGRHQILIIADELDEGFLRTMIINHHMDSIKVCAIRKGETFIDDPCFVVLSRPPESLDQVPTFTEAWIRRTATALFLVPGQMVPAESRISEFVVIHIGGLDYEDQRARLGSFARYLRSLEGE